MSRSRSRTEQDVAPSTAAAAARTGPAAADRRRIEALLAWFARHRRDLPWRRRRDGYTALVAEAMLQQTQVVRVVERFEAFLERFPTVSALAAAGEQDVLAVWQGLGYYRRARNLHAAARMVVDRFDGEVPRDAATLAGLPGVGRYTAGAVASIVHGEPAPIVDGNVQRVIARWDDFAGPPAERETVARTWRRAEELVAAAADPGAFNEAMMELGALVCTPRSPACARCPVAADCGAARAGRQDHIPPPRPPARQKTVHHHAVVMVRGGRLLLEQRAERGLWSGMWQPPTVESPGRLGPAAVVEALAARSITVSDMERSGGFEHQTTHRRVSFHVFRARTRRRRGEWIALDRLDERPMSNAHRRLVREFVVGVGSASAELEGCSEG